MQTHVAENRAEVRWVRELFPEARSYLDVYAPAGLLHAKSVLRARHLARRRRPRRAAPTPARRSRTARRRTCSSAAACSAGAPPRPRACSVSLASDVGGGTSLSMLRNMADAYKVQALRRRAADRLEGAARGDARRGAGARPRATRSARSTPAAMADVCVWDCGRRRGGDAPRTQVARTLHERVFAWMTLGDERNLVEAFVAGESRYRRSRPRTEPAPESHAHASRARRHQQAVPGGEGQRPGQPARRARRDPRRARRERRRQVDADEDHLRRRPARRRRDPLERRAGADRIAGSRRARSASAWCSSTSACSTR